MLALLNRLKAEVRREILTDSQQLALERIERLWRFPGRVNLWGPPGSGKTMVAWVLSRTSGASLYPSPQAFEKRSSYGEPRAIIDNVPYEQTALRLVLAEVQIKSCQTALLISEKPNVLGLTAVEIASPTVEDIDVVYRNLSLLDFYALAPLREGSLWAVIHSVL
jgi:hypothetical protein